MNVQMEHECREKILSFIASRVDIYIPKLNVVKFTIAKYTIVTIAKFTIAKIRKQTKCTRTDN